MITVKTEEQNIKGTLLFVHGAWHGAWCWEENFMTFFAAQGYHCYALDLTKHGEPGKVKGINKIGLRTYVKDVEKAVSEINDDVIIVGHSMGGLVVQKFLEKHTCQKAILLAPAPTSGVLPTTVKLLTRGAMYPTLFTLNLYRLINSPQKAKWTLFSNQIDASLLTHYTNKLGNESMLAFLQMLIPRVKITKNSNIPMCVFAGDQDNLFTIKEMKSTARRFKADLQIIPSIAHDMMLDNQHQEVSQSMLNWLSKN